MRAVLPLAWPGAGSRRATQSRSRLPNSAEAAAVFYGLALVGATLVPVGHTAGPRELNHALRESGARALVVWNQADRRFAFDALAPDLPRLEHVVAIGDAPTPASVIDFDE